MEGIKKFNKYYLLEQQEETGIGALWRGANIADGKIQEYFLLNLVNEKLAGNDDFVDQFLNQSMTTSKLEHPNILRQVTNAPENGQLASVYEFHEGFSLEKVLERCNSDGFPLSIDHALLVTSKMLSALAYAKTKHMTHGFINPSVVFVTHEGEIKLTSFQFNTALRALPGLVADLEPTYGPYVPTNMDYTAEDRDQLDIFGCGSILFEMLTGERFNQNGAGDVAARIKNATTASEGENIPAAIANILISALDSGAGSAYTDIQKMAKDMDDLLYSGEYSPTTFNLAFFMHSAFRIEMEELGEKMNSERERNFSGEVKAAAPAASAVATTPKAEPAAVQQPRAPQGVPAPAAPTPKSKAPLFIGLGVAAAAIAVVAVLFLQPAAEPEKDTNKDLAAQIQQEGQDAAEERLRELQEETERLNNLMAEQQAQARREAEEAKAKELEDDLKRMEDQLQQAKMRQEQQELMAKLDQQRKELEARQQRLAKLEEDRKRREANEARRKAEADKTRKNQGSNTIAKVDKPRANDTKVNQPKEQSKPASSSPTPTEPATTNQTVSNVAANNDATPASDITPPRMGELIPLDDPDLNKPTPLTNVETLKVPKKAIRNDVVKRGATIVFLMKVLVNETGSVDQVNVMRSPIKAGQNDYGMIDDAIKTARNMRFSTPTKLGVPVKTEMYIGINFRAN
ncbi:protein kinase domain-containing protein [Acanthopleuribacter pedis]|uniref:Protein kinase n=1 Tax=Acanthopleuribacter pedis TaxID=442870 RepID=A0A8J7QDL9_9BACT|nr:protein kinase [Acanthopleuribacter pedis]MBO1319136.1 protein kinase [Acanthopleuribacter pedis]